MGDYFKPWRRKIGIVTLVMALVFMAGWVRSLTICDLFSCPLGKFIQVYLASENQTLLWSYQKCIVPPFPTYGAHPLQTVKTDKYYVLYAVNWKWRWFRFGFGERICNEASLVIPPHSHPVVAVPYFSIVLLLTLLSAFLILWKPRKMIQETIMEPAPAEGT